MRRAARLARIAPELAAALLGALIVVVLVALLVASAARPGRDSGQIHRAAAGPRRRQELPGASGEGSAAAATAAAIEDLLAFGRAAIGTNAQARRIIGAVATGGFEAELDRTLPPVSERLATRLGEHGTPAFLTGWPLGYRMLALRGGWARIAIWHLDVAASATLGLASAQYRTTTYTLRWTRAGWRVAAAQSAAGPTPPSSASASALDAFARAASSFDRYRYAP
jgi:hypothetical protein